MPLWYPVEKQRKSGDIKALCEVCRQFTGRSSLIIGSPFPITKLVEWHKCWAPLEKLRDSSEGKNHSCHICKLVWYLISKARCNQIKRGINSVSVNDSQLSPRPTMADKGTPLIQHRAKARLKIEYAGVIADALYLCATLLKRRRSECSTSRA